jgi:hypothetical protein
MHPSGLYTAYATNSLTVTAGAGYVFRAKNYPSQSPQFFEVYAVIAGCKPTRFAEMQDVSNTGNCAEQGQMQVNV